MKSNAGSDPSNNPNDVKQDSLATKVAVVTGAYRIGESERLSEIGAKYRVNKEAASEIVGEFQELGAVARAKNSSAAVPVPRPEEIQEVYEIRAALEEIHLHYVAKWMTCAPHFAAATWIAL